MLILYVMHIVTTSIVRYIWRKKLNSHRQWIRVQKSRNEVCETLGIKHIFSSVYTLEANGRLEGWHRFFKACIAKHIRGGGVEWEELVPLAVSAYNFFLCQSTKEFPFVLMFGRDPITPVAKLLEPRLRYYAERGASLKMDTL